MRRLAGKTALVTGAAHGQGRAHCVRLASEGADIIAIDLCAQALNVAYPLGSWEALQETARQVEELGRRCFIAKADIRDRAALDQVVSDTAAEFPRLDILVANAGMGSYGRVLETPAAVWEQVVAVNMTGTFHTIQAFTPRILEGGNGGSIIIISSVSGIKGLPFTGAYAASKHGLQGLAAVLAQELAAHGIRVNTVNPGPVATPLTSDETGPALLAGDHPDTLLFKGSFSPLLPLAGGFLEAKEISATVAWLASDDSRFVTGLAVPVDAGVMAR
ncbi:mycofactocin-coupled SDR family oxidoreductase [Acrocarpospora macrocephala]|uniref:Putative short-chain dehydrogenase/reductase n=1 Tax=Acrocarpospora macrocephala TaxID=150177 RepID=A0A5M3WFQ3_9ACTN|nr:mycofactocin-coupled SDR family oxidoreductase [Acrocarpospora macrocephala]GES07169.1 putative short-chain dehydrogenase/reductase [Acrocarpospora macrocephala]